MILTQLAPRLINQRDAADTVCEVDDDDTKKNLKLLFNEDLRDRDPSRCWLLQVPFSHSDLDGCSTN